VKSEAASTFPTGDEFTDAYIIAALWASTDNVRPNGCNPMDKNYTGTDLDRKSLQQVIQTCQTFQTEHVDLLGEATQRPGYNSERAGHDFWLTRNGYRAGYSDRNELQEGGLGDKLTKAAKAYGESDIYVGNDGKLYVNEALKRGRQKKTYVCDSCGRISTITQDKGRCNFCESTTHVSPEDAVEIPIPKSVWGSDFVAVVYRGKVVDIFLLSDRTSVHGCIGHELVQEYVDNLGPSDETRKMNDIEVTFGNNV
jgi:hypothetical protein